MMRLKLRKTRIAQAYCSISTWIALKLLMTHSVIPSVTS
ncbi:Uncharacterised protein [Vibrio cholerae]|nr:Uncharacterised protein [Vibrio cholerae]